jgi:hypothetical protein
MSENEFKEIVLADYDLKRAAGLLTAELTSPTPGSLKAESVRVCEMRFHLKDEVLLSSFFNQKENGAAYRMAIQNSSADLFRPLSSFLRDRTINTTLRNINLLAWLIDFQPRPYHPDLRHPVQPVKTKFEPDKLDEKPPVNPPGHFQPLYGQPAPARTGMKTFTFISALAALLVSGYLVYFYINRPSGQERCMIWEDDHYQPVNCQERTTNRLMIPIDRQRLNVFKKIREPDTLSLYSVGKTWYAKYKGRVEFYTAAGIHPLDTNRRLLPVSNHILNKYVYHLEN